MFSTLEVGFGGDIAHLSPGDDDSGDDGNDDIND